MNEDAFETSRCRSTPASHGLRQSQSPRPATGSACLPVRCARGAALDDRRDPEVTDNPVFYYAHYGADQRAKELGDVDVIWTGPTSRTPTRKRRCCPS